MIVVRVELWSAVTGETTEIARMLIDNIGGTHTRGNYRCRTLKGRSRQALDRAMVRTGGDGIFRTVQREGRVEGHPRLREHVWNLVAKALAATGYGKKGGQADA